MLEPESRARSLARRFDNVLVVLASLEDRRETLTPAAADLLTRVRETVEATRAAFEDRWDKLAAVHPAALRDGLRARLCDQMLRVLATVAGSLLPTLDGAASSGIPVELDAVLARLVAKADPSQPLVVLSSAPGFQYSVQPVQDPLQIAAAVTLASPAAATGPNYLFLRLPRLERDSALLHVVLTGHEVGHVRDWTQQVSAGLIPAPLLLNGVPAGASDARVYRTLIAYWARELAADMFGALVFGPASLLSFTELAVTGGDLTSDSLTHPATARRLEAIIKLLDGLGYGSVVDVEAAVAPLRAATAGAAQTPVSVNGVDPRISQAAWGWLSGQLPQLAATCSAGVAPDETLVPAKWPQVEQAADELARGRPAGERASALGANGEVHAIEPVPAAVVLNAGWLLRARDYAGLSDVVASPSPSHSQSSGLGAVLDGLLLKSLEVSEWRDAKPWKR